MPNLRGVLQPSLPESLSRLLRVWLSKRECVSVHSGKEKLDSESPVAYRPLLANKLVEPIFGHRTVTIHIRVHAVIRAGSFAAYRDAEADCLPGFRRTQD